MEAATHKTAAVRPLTTHQEPDTQDIAGEVGTNS